MIAAIHRDGQVKPTQLPKCLRKLEYIFNSAFHSRQRRKTNSHLSPEKVDELTVMREIFSV